MKGEFPEKLWLVVVCIRVIDPLKLWNTIFKYEHHKIGLVYGFNLYNTNKMDLS